MERRAPAAERSRREAAIGRLLDGVRLASASAYGREYGTRTCAHRQLLST